MDLPARPDLPQEKKRWGGWKIAGAAVIGLLLLGAIQDFVGSEKTTPPPTTPVTTIASTGISQENRVLADATWELQGAADQEMFCDGVDSVGRTEASRLFLEGLGSGWTSTEAEQIVSYLYDTYC